jgi:hypothetical protein
MAPRLSVFLSLTLLPVAALAHGEEVLVAVYGQAIAVAATLLSLWLVPSFRPSRLVGSLACVVGAALAWLVLGPLPFLEHRALISLAAAAAPVILAVAVVYASKHHAANRA